MNKILDSIDEFLNSQKEQEQQLFFFLPILIFGFLSYYFLYPITDENLNRAVKLEKKINKEIKQTKSKIDELKANNLKLKNVLKTANKKLKTLNTDKEHLNLLVSQLGFLKFDLSKWANFYDSIPKLAQKHHLFILSLDNEMYEPNSAQLVQKKMSIKITAVGDFIDFIKFIDEFESKKELIKIRALQINQDQMIVDIDIYGAEL